MKSLNDLIWNTEEDLDKQSDTIATYNTTGGGDMQQFCIGAFCTGATSGFVCIKEAPARTAVCV